MQAVTRGNGHYGYDITATVKNMDGFPKQLKQDIDIEIRGECLINEADFEFFNTNGEYSNSRNFVAGTLNALDTSLAKTRRLFICCYDIRSINGKTGQNMSTEDAHNLIQSLGFMTVKHWIFKSSEIDKTVLPPSGSMLCTKSEFITQPEQSYEFSIKLSAPGAENLL